MAVVAYYIRTPPQAVRKGSANWLATNSFNVGDYIDISSASPVGQRSWVYYCTTAGTTGSSQPSFTTSENGTTNDGSVVWTAHKPTNISYPAAGRWAVYQDIKDNHSTDYIVIYVDYATSSDYVDNSPVPTVFTSGTRPPNITVVSYDFAASKPRNGAFLSIGTQAFFGAGFGQHDVDNFGTKSYHWKDSLTSKTRRLTYGTTEPGSYNEYIDCNIRFYTGYLYGDTRGTYVNVTNFAGTNTDLSLLTAQQKQSRLVGVTLKEAGSQAYDDISQLQQCYAVGLHYDYAYSNLAFKFGGGYANILPMPPFGGCGWVSSTAEQVNAPSYNGSACSWLWTTQMYRDSAATLGSTNGSFIWYGISKSCSLGAHSVSPYIGVYVSSSGAKTFTVEFITQSPHAMYTDEVWLDVQYPVAAGTWQYSMATSMHTNTGMVYSRTLLTTSSVTWTNGTGIEDTYFAKYKLQVTATLGRAGPVYLRLVCATNKLAEFSRTYVCPQVDIA